MPLFAVPVGLAAMRMDVKIAFREDWFFSHGVRNYASEGRERNILGKTRDDFQG